MKCQQYGENTFHQLSLSITLIFTNCTRYNFFLDEMIAIYNRHKADVLKDRGQKPFLLNEDFLREPISLTDAV